MHELGIAESVLTAVRTEMALHKAPRVEKIGLRIGPMAGVERSSLTFCYDAIVKGTEFEQTILEITDGSADELELAFLEVEE